MTYITYIYYDVFFLTKLHLHFSLHFTQNVVIVELLFAYFAFVEDDHSSTLLMLQYHYYTCR